MPNKKKRLNRVPRIVPVEKKPEVTSPDNIHDRATLDDYEKIAAKMAISSDRVIDEALDRMEARDRRAMDEHTPPQPEDNVEVEGDDPPAEYYNPPAPSDCTEPPAPLETPDVPSRAAEQNENRELAQESRVLELESENIRLTAELKRLKKTLEGISVVDTAEMFKNEIKSLTDKNDELILRNSELEFEISRLKAENNTLRQTLESIENFTRLPPQTVSAGAYCKSQQNVCADRRPAMNPILRPPHRTMNGYESWN